MTRPWPNLCRHDSLGLPSETACFHFLPTGCVRSHSELPEAEQGSWPSGLGFRPQAHAGRVSAASKVAYKSGPTRVPQCRPPKSDAVATGGSPSLGCRFGSPSVSPLDARLEKPAEIPDWNLFECERQASNARIRTNHHKDSGCATQTTPRMCRRVRSSPGPTRSPCLCQLHLGPDLAARAVGTRSHEESGRVMGRWITGFPAEWRVSNRLSVEPSNTYLSERAQFGPGFSTTATDRFWASRTEVSHGPLSGVGL
jgi:hypothetical protein